MFAPAPEPLSTQLAADYAVNASLAVWSHALLNTSLYPLDPKPAWFDRVNTRLAAAKKTTGTWLIEDYPHVASSLPQSLIDYGNNFVSGADQLIAYLSKELTADARRDVFDLIGELQDVAVTQQFRVKGLQKKVEKFSTFVKEFAATMAKDQKEILASLSGARKDVERLQDRINDLFRELGITATEAKAAMEAAAMKGVSIFGTMFVYSISAVVTTTASLPIVGLGIGVLALTIVAIQEKSKSDTIIEKMREITALQMKLTGEQTQVAALQSMAEAVATLSDVARAALTNMTGSVHYWDDFTNNLALAKELVEKNVNVRELTPFQNLAAAKASWKKIVDSAKNVQSSVFTIESPIEIGGTAA
ncbi:MAG TPA: HBL/NHE enterotoxin family protein [Thermoanaerobaculia bacterium]|jgi:hypothetical protein|nr:HBL/NHE enterotoxin family protein [Thermoanaerobaculia bacterium]